MNQFINNHRLSKLCLFIKFNQLINQVISWGGDKLILKIEYSEQNRNWILNQFIVMKLDYAISTIIS
ncbi:unnamed protein product [Paramecium octaurelia]|uniref:Uncharacterized protein n=1 Tax=Paramecium octaurelia TaxID=43137 RepID=A0A8S1SAA5_PAROT|nr:unnamed protein product [Paramecium octaurelia]